MANIAKQEAALKAKRKLLQKQLDGVDKELTHVGQVKSGDRPNPEQARKIKNQAYSFTVHFERRKTLRRVRSPGAVCRSLRRFTSKEEAVQHGKRFTRIHNHKGYSVIRVNSRANAWINWRTGKTNPILNK